MAGTGVFAEIKDGEVYKYYADGEWKISASKKSVAIVNPTTRKTHYKVQGTTNLSICACFIVWLIWVDIVFVLFIRRVFVTMSVCQLV